jgi:choline-sulfatase
VSGGQRLAIVTFVLVGIGALGWWARGRAPEPDPSPPPPAPPVVSPPPPEDAPRPVARGPNLLLFTIDTLRGDHVGAAGYPRAVTPNLDALAARGAYFSRAYAPSAWTAPSLVSLLTSVIPDEHGVQRGHPFMARIVAQETIAEGLPSLASSLRGAGYLTVGVTANGHLLPELGFERGFDRYTCAGFVGVDQLGPAVREVLPILDRADEPFFLWVHALDPHTPYAPLGPALETFWPAERPRFPELAAVPFPEGYALALGGRLPNEEERAFLVAAYDADVRTVDDYLGELLAALPDEPLVVVVASDHGEEFGEHGRHGHGHQLYEETVRVPLVIALPGGTPRQIATPVSLLDVLPTLLELAGAPPAPLARGRTLAPALRGEPLDPAPIVIETSRLEDVRALVDGDLKYVARRAPEPGEALFDLAADPGELRDLSAERPDDLSRLRALLRTELDGAVARRPVPVTVPLDEATLERLRALGYGH